MNSLLIAFSTIAPLFLIIFIGIAFSKHKSVNESWIKILNDYALWIGFPALIFAALVKTDINFTLFGPLIAYNSAYIIFSILLAFPVASIFKLDTKTKQTLFFAFAFGNVSYLGIPVLQNTYGNAILPQATMISAVYLFWLFTLCIYLVERYSDTKQTTIQQIKSLITNPLLVAVFAGIVFSVLKIKIPAIMMQSIDMFASSVTAIILLSLGIFLGTQPLGRFHDWKPALGFSLLIMIALPLLFFGIILNFAEEHDYRSWILEAAMPMGLTPYVLSAKYGLNTSFASKVVVVSTVLAIFILPFWIFLLG